MELVDGVLPPPGPAEVTVEIAVAAVNFADIYQRRGIAYRASLPSGLGFEAAGRIAALGDGVSGWKIGDRVALVDGENCYAEAVNVAADLLISLSDDMANDTAMALLGKAMTVEYLLERCAPVPAGSTILFHAAAGGVGLIACQWAKALGLTLIGTVSTEEKAALARAHGCDHAIDTRREDFADRVLEITGGTGVPAVFDSIGRDTLERSLKCVSRRGVLVSFGQSSGHPDPVAPRALVGQGSIYLTRPSLGDYVTNAGERSASAARVIEMHRAGHIRAHIGGRYKLADAARAHADLEARRTTGSCVLEV